MKDLTLKVAEGKLNIRVAAWIEHEDQILVSAFPDGTISLVGGRLKFSETTIEGIQREVFEETGEDFHSPVLLQLLKTSFVMLYPKSNFMNFYTFIKVRFSQNYPI